MLNTNAAAALLNHLHVPLWIFDVEQGRKIWANSAAIALENDFDLEAFASWCDRAEDRHILEALKQGERLTGQWSATLPERSISLNCLGCRLELSEGRWGLSIEGQHKIDLPVEAEALRALEALRYSPYIVSLYRLDGTAIAQNPESLSCYGDETEYGTEAFRRRFLNPAIAEQAIAQIEAGSIFSIKTQVKAGYTLRWHQIDVERVRDPVAQTPMILVHEKDIADVMQLEVVELELRQRDRLLAGIAQATTYLLTAEDCDTAMGQALAALGAAAEADRLYVYEKHLDPVTHTPLKSARWEWTAENMPSDLDNPDLYNIPYQSGFPKWHDVLSRHKLLSHCTREFSSPEREWLEARHIRSLLVIPIEIEESWWGFLEFDDCQRDRHWTESEKSILQVAAGIIGGAIARFRAERKLAEFNAQLERRVEERTAELQAVNAKLHYNAYHDVLTGLPNRAFFIDQLEWAFAETQQNSNYGFAVLFLDLDRFKVINDSLGHALGDKLLIKIAHQLETCLGDRGLVARFGGDEFAILLDQTDRLEDATDIADRIHQTLKPPFSLQGQTIFTTVSIGIALSSTGYSRPEELLRDADLVMYHAKERGRSRSEVFDATMHERIVARLELESELRQAVRDLEVTRSGVKQRRDRFQLHYQPIVNLKTGQIVAFEALARWQHPPGQLTPPGQFITIAEETGAIVPLGHWVLYEACRQLRIWQEQSPDLAALKMSINLSARQFSYSHLIRQIDRVLSQTGVSGSAIKLEITESVLMDNSDLATQMLQQLKERDIQLCMDDFGTGYSSLNYLHRFPLDTLKIDRSFVSQMGEKGEKSAIVQTIIALAKNLGMEIIAEGVEKTVEQQTLLRLGCELGQGYLFSKPVDARAAGELLKLSRDEGSEN